MSGKSSNLDNLTCSSMLLPPQSVLKTDSEISEVSIFVRPVRLVLPNSKDFQSYISFKRRMPPSLRHGLQQLASKRKDVDGKSARPSRGELFRSCLVDAAPSPTVQPEHDSGHVKASSSSAPSGTLRLSLFRVMAGSQASPSEHRSSAGKRSLAASLKLAAGDSKEGRRGMFQRAAAAQAASADGPRSGTGEALTSALIEEVSAKMALQTAATATPSTASGQRKRPRYNNSGRAATARLSRLQKHGGAGNIADKRASSDRLEALLDKTSCNCTSGECFQQLASIKSELMKLVQLFAWKPKEVRGEILRRVCADGVFRVLGFDIGRECFRALLMIGKVRLGSWAVSEHCLFTVVFMLIRFRRLKFTG